MKVVLLGPPGAGKGTQCKRIVEKYGLLHISSGDIFRAEIATGSELGNRAKGYIDAGQLVPDEIVIDMMVGAIDKASGRCVLDGFPRTVVQAEELDKALALKGEKIDVVVNLIVEDEEVASRLTKRRSCPECGAVFHLDFLKPKCDGKCDIDGVSLVQRDDDKPDVVLNRLKTYHELTEPLVGYYNTGNSPVLAISAGRAIDEVTTEIFKKLDSLQLG